MEIIQQHIWCNKLHKDEEAKDCKMCKGLWGLYPYTTEEESKTLATRHFPEAVKRTN